MTHSPDPGEPCAESHAPVSDQIDGVTGAPQAQAARSPRAEEILDHAMRLFAANGYETTSVAQIQQAAGMTPGSGALYKHFPSKRALLEAGVERFIDAGKTAAAGLPHPTDADLTTLLRNVGERALGALERDQATMRVVWRDLPAFPDLSRRFVDARLQFGFDQLAGWLSALSERGQAEVDDPEATAAVLLGALAFFRVMEAMLGDRPGRVSDDRFVAAWTRVASRALDPAHHATDRTHRW